MKPLFTFSNKQEVGVARKLASIAVQAALALPLAAARACGFLKPEMFLDKELQFSDSQALTATALSTNVINLGAARSLGNGEPMAVVFNVEVAADQTTGDEDYTFAVEVASDAAITTARKELGRLSFESGTPTAPALDADLLIAGFKFAIPLPPTTPDWDEQYLGVRYTLAGTTPTITVSAHLQPLSMVEVGSIHVADGFTIS